MLDDYFPTAEIMAEWTTSVAQFIPFGILLAFSCWAIGYVVWFVIDIFRGI